MADLTGGIVESSRLLLVPWKFAVHAVLGICIFGVITAAAILLNVVVVNPIEGSAVDPVIVFGIKTGEYLLFGVDFVLFVVYLCRAAWQLIKELKTL